MKRISVLFFFDKYGIMRYEGSEYMELINQTLIMTFLAIIAASCVTFPILYLVQKNKQHKELIQTLKEINQISENINDCKESQ